MFSKLTIDNDLFVEFLGSVCFVKDIFKGKILLQGIAEKGLYKLQLNSSSQSTYTYFLSQCSINTPVSMLSQCYLNTTVNSFCSGKHFQSNKNTCSTDFSIKCLYFTKGLATLILKAWFSYLRLCIPICALQIFLIKQQSISMKHVNWANFIDFIFQLLISNPNQL